MPDGETTHDGQPGGEGNAAFPSPQPRPPGYFQCADPMRLRPEDAAASKVDLHYIGAYQWGQRCQTALEDVCQGELGDSVHCSVCVELNELALVGACGPSVLGETCDSCSVALRASEWTVQGVRERCAELGVQASSLPPCLRAVPARCGRL